MTDNKMLQGLLLICIVCLLGATAVTLLDYSRYTEDGSARVAAAAEAAPETATAPESASVLRLAPEDTWAVGIVDVKALLAAQIIQALKPEAEPGMPAMDPTQMAQGVDSVATFGFTAGEEMLWCALVECQEGARAALEQQIVQMGEQVTVAGLTAYAIKPPAAEPGMAPMAPADIPGVPDLSAQEGVLAFADDTTLLAGSSESALGTMIANYQGDSGAGVGSELQQLLQGQAGSQVQFAAVLPGALSDLVPEGQAGEVPAGLASLKGGALGVNLAADVKLAAMLRLGTDADAQQVVQEATAQLDPLKQQVQQMAQADAAMQPLADAVNGISVSSAGTDVNMSATLTADAIKSLPALVMAAMMGGMGGAMDMGGEAMPEPAFDFGTE